MDKLTDQEKKELELLDNPEIKFLAPTIGAINPFTVTNMSKRKERVVNLRTRQKMFEQGLDENKDWQKYYKIKEEEERCFDKRFSQ